LQTNRPVTQGNAPVETTHPAGAAPVTKQQSGAAGGHTWEYLVVGAYNDPSQGQKVLNQYGAQGCEFEVRSGDYYYFKRAR
jgi:hypothetical protein